MAAQKDVTLRKRQQIDSSNKTMFAFVAGAAFIGGIAIVVGIMLIQQIIFHSKIILEKQNTISVLDKNINAVDDLKGNVRVLDTNEALASIKSSEESSALQVILDALPDNPNADAVGASLKTKFIDTVSGIEINNLSVTPAGDESAESTEVANAIQFSFEVKGSAIQLKELLSKLERSIRVFELSSIEVSASNEGVVMSVRGYAYYEPAKSVKLEKKVIKP